MKDNFGDVYATHRQTWWLWPTRMMSSGRSKEPCLTEGKSGKAKTPSPAGIPLYIRRLQMGGGSNVIYQLLASAVTGPGYAHQCTHVKPIQQPQVDLRKIPGYCLPTMLEDVCLFWKGNGRSPLICNQRNFVLPGIPAQILFKWVSSCHISFPRSSLVTPARLVSGTFGNACLR